MNVHVGVAVSGTDPIRGQLFMVMTVSAEAGTGGRMIFGIEPGQASFTEAELKTFLAAEYKMLSNEIDESIKDAKSESMQLPMASTKS